MLYEFYICLLNAYSNGIYGTEEMNEWFEDADKIEKKLIMSGVSEKTIAKISKLAYKNA